MFSQAHDLIEINRYALERAYYAFYRLAIEKGLNEDENPDLQTLNEFTEALTSMGVLEPDEPEEEEEDLNTSTNWDEWFWENKRDQEAVEKFLEDRF